MPTPKNIVLPMIAPKSLFPKVFMSISINLMIGRYAFALLSDVRRRT